MPLLNLGTAELLMIISVHCLFIWAIRGLWVFALIGCWANEPSSNNGWDFWDFWAIFLLVEGALMLLTAYKIFSYRNEMNRTVTMPSRDSIVYFAVVFGCLMLCVIAFSDHIISISLAIPTQCIAIAVGHMMMNIRGLILEDPERTLYLQTLQFARRTHSGSDVELEVVRAE